MYRISGEWALLAKIFLGEKVEIFTKRGKMYIDNADKKEEKRKHGKTVTYH